MIDLGAWFGGKSEAWRKLADRQPVEAIDEDTGEIIDIRPSQDDPTDIEGLLLRFRYTNANGHFSRRVVLCHQCWVEGRQIYIRGKCTMREALRTFRIDRMTDVFEVRSRRKVGDLKSYFRSYALPPDLSDDGFPSDDIDIPEVRLTFHKPSLAEIEAQAFRQHTQHRARKDCIAGLRVLAYVALADDIRSDAERNVEISFLESRLAMCGYDHDPEMTNALVEVAAALAVPPGSFTRAVNVVAEDQSYYLLVLSAARLLADLDGNVDSIETRAIQKLISAGTAKGIAIPPA